jgi:D-serine dehydratase
MKDIERIEIKAWKDKYPLLNKLISTEEVFWINPNLEKFQTGIKKSPLTLETEAMSKGTHIVWATGGSMVPEKMMAQYYQKGLELASGK